MTRLAVPCPGQLLWPISYGTRMFSDPQLRTFASSLAILYLNICGLRWNKALRHSLGFWYKVSPLPKLKVRSIKRSLRRQWGALDLYVRHRNLYVGDRHSVCCTRRDEARTLLPLGHTT